MASFDPSTSITVVLSYRNITAGIDRIGLGAALPHLEMEVVAGRVARAAHDINYSIFIYSEYESSSSNSKFNITCFLLIKINYESTIRYYN